MSDMNINSSTVNNNDASSGVEAPKKSFFKKTILSVLAVATIGMCGVGFWASQEPDLVKSEQILKEMGVKSPVVGSHTAAAQAYIVQTLLTKNGGYLSNDILPPFSVLDNMPNFEYGALIAVRDLGRNMRNHFARSQSQSKENESLKNGEPPLHFDNSTWGYSFMANSEAQYFKSLDYFKQYQADIEKANDPDNQFFARADNLRNHMLTVSQRLGGYSNALGSSVGETRENLDLANDSSAEQSTHASSVIYEDRSWFDVDDTFYEARGYAWASAIIFEALEKDFDLVLEKKAAHQTMKEITRNFVRTQEDVLVVLNGSGFSVFTNHSLIMSSYISRANAAVRDMAELLSNG